MTMAGPNARDLELAAKALEFVMMFEEKNRIERIALLFALARHEGAREAIRDMQDALLEMPSRGADQ